MISSRWKDSFPFFRSPFTKTPRTPAELRRVWFEHNGVRPRAFTEYCPELLERAAEFKYIHWPFSIREWVKGRDLVDLGCGRSLHGVGFLMAGVRSYTGLDPIVDLDLDSFKDPRIQRTFNKKNLGWTPRRIAERLPRIRYRTSTIEDLAPEEKWDVMVMHNVTEHLMNIDTVFEHIPRHLRHEGLLVYRHPNHFAWNGHHMKPRFVEEIDSTESEQQRYLDWNHVTFDPTWPDTIRLRQNRIRLHEIRALTEKHFEILQWEPEHSTEKEGLHRMTDEIAARYAPDFSQEELITQSVLCLARVKG